MLHLFLKLSLGTSLMMSLFSKKWLLVWALIELLTVLLVSLMGASFSPRMVESMSKYYMVNAVASAILLSGILFRYYLKDTLLIFSSYEGLSYFLMLISLLIKIAVFPNPFWFMEVISGAGFLRGFYILIVSKILPLYLFVKLVAPKSLFLYASGLGAVILGSVYGLNQTNLRKLVALSSVAHLGWLIVGLPHLSLLSCLLMAVFYLGMIFPLVWVSGQYELEDLKSINQCYFQPALLVLVILSLLSLGGLPPTLGFIYKLYMFMGLVESASFMVLSVLILMSVVSLFFYMRVCFLLYSTYWPEQKILSAGKYMSLVNKVWIFWFSLMICSVFLGVCIFLIGVL